MSKKTFRRRPLFTIPQIGALVFVIAGLIIAIDLRNRARAGRLVGVGEEELIVAVSGEETRQVELRATATYVSSDDYVASYARNEGGYLLSGEKRVVPLLIEATPVPASAATPTPDPAHQARPWMAWWRLLTDAPYPTR
jgi:hypothetical protein